MKRKGFTLLELLAVIIILAVIALIATPIVLNVVDEAKKGAFSASANGLVDAIRYQALESQFAGNTVAKEYTFPSTDIKVQGSQPDGGTASVDKDGNIQIAIYNDKWCAIKSYTDSVITVKEYVEGECVVGEALTQLTAPTISIENNILSITSGDENTEKYAIYVDGTLKTTINATNTFDLSTIELEVGAYSITVKALADSYADSIASNTVSYAIESAIPTIKGKWVFKDDHSIGTPISISSISFNSNNTQYTSINFNYGGEFGGIIGYYDSTPVYDQLGRTLSKAYWQNEAYRTVDFGSTEQTVSDTFYNWLTENATKQ